jgi:hypothetical protein
MDLGRHNRERLDHWFSYSLFFRRKAVTAVTKKERKEVAQVLLDSAEYISTHILTGCCNAIVSQDRKEFLINDAICLFTDLFKEDAYALPDHAGLAFWFRGNNENPEDPEINHRRIMGLCLAAHLVEIGEIG